MNAEDKEPFALVTRADFRRAEEAALNLAAQAEKVSSYPLATAFGEHPADVLDEDEPGAGLDEDAPGRAPEVALVGSPEPLSGHAVRLTGNTPDDAIHAATEASARDGSHIAPHRRFSHDTLLHLRDQINDGDCFPLHAQDRASSRDCQLDGPIKAASAGAKADDVEGTNSHIGHDPFRGLGPGLMPSPATTAPLARWRSKKLWCTVSSAISISRDRRWSGLRCVLQAPPQPENL